eukprot:13615479-Alexandrium_andersonii.AAC.1
MRSPPLHGCGGPAATDAGRRQPSGWRRKGLIAPRIGPTVLGRRWPWSGPGMGSLPPQEGGYPVARRPRCASVPHHLRPR